MSCTARPFPDPTDLFWNRATGRDAETRADRAGPRFDSTAPLAFHRRLPGHAVTPLHDVTTLARRLGVGQVLVKDESRRLGLPAFKMLGASWAVYRALQERLPALGDEWDDIVDLQGRVAPLRPLTLAATTDGVPRKRD